MFANPVDIGNRCCQHCGVTRIADFTEDSLQAGEIAFTYDKVRRAELRRNTWRFAIRNVALRPIDATTIILSPTLWASTTTYAFGAIVQDSAGVLWQSRVQDNLNNAPGNSNAWEQYCGPLTVQPYDTTGTTGYFTGELVYQTPGDGTALVYLSLVNNNSQDPRVPTLWISTTQYGIDQVVQFYSLWAIGTTYAAGNTIAYNKIAYVSLSNGNVGNQPDISSTKWAPVSATIAPPYYNAATTYSIGNFVTLGGVNYVSIVNANIGNAPPNASFWAVQAAGTYYSSLIAFNLNNDPSLSPAPWLISTTYAAGNKVAGSDGTIYTSIGSGNVGNDPTKTIGLWTNTGVLVPWTTVNPFGTANDAWLQLPVALSTLQLASPISYGPVAQQPARNVYRLPSSFLRRAPQDPKAGSTSFLGAPTGLMYEDWNLQGNYIVSKEVYPILLRFVADVTDVSNFDDLFCEGLAARIAYEVVERLTQSSSKRAEILAAYNLAMSTARMVNGIEVGPVEAPEDDYITARI